MKPQLLSRIAADTFYHLHDVSLQGRGCQGLACFAARKLAPQHWQEAARSDPRLYCLGKCYRAPADTDSDSRPHVAVRARQSVLLGNVIAGGARDHAGYRQRGGGAALLRARSMTPDAIIGEIAASGLRGRGGAGFPTARKWQAVASEPAALKYVVANADEGDAGAYSDRFLMEDDPLRLIEAMAIAARATGASHGYIYLRKEYPLAAATLTRALQEARTAGWLGANFDIELFIGHGSYVCGEETALLNSIEGRRPEVRSRPPLPTGHGLFDAPTLVDNVETLCALPWIVEHGGDRYQALGFSNSRGTKLVTLNSLFRRPGLYEVEFGITLREIVDELGGGLARGALKGLMVGGPLAGIVPPHLLDTQLGFEEMQNIGAAVGHGGIIAFGDDTAIGEIVEQVFRFGAYESCGKCTPCHLGSPEVARMFGAAVAGGKIEAARYHSLIDALAQTSLCGHGRGLAEFARSVETHYREELSPCFK